MKLEFKWLNKYPDYSIEDSEDFVYLSYKGKVIERYYANNRRLTQDFLKRKLNKLERIANENKQRT